MRTIDLSYYEVKLEDEGGTERYVGCFDLLLDANRAVKACEKKGWYGSPTRVSKTIRVFQNYDEYTNESRRKTRLDILSKLTPDEIEALGIK